MFYTIGIIIFITCFIWAVVSFGEWRYRSAVFFISMATTVIGVMFYRALVEIDVRADGGDKEISQVQQLQLPEGIKLQTDGVDYRFVDSYGFISPFTYSCESDAIFAACQWHRERQIRHEWKDVE